ncbi:MAG: hypothetical protein F9K21_05980 [Rhodocyclaceae bacterium]|nr:MAG: hypothetical protein F9K21_05980 [Rhodocyclaceae bacterium]CAG0929139.1 hypothetical protein RHDC3_01001 [Rhodocyclaceae bacterium]
MPKKTAQISNETSPSEYVYQYGLTTCVPLTDHERRFLARYLSEFIYPRLQEIADRVKTPKDLEKRTGIKKPLDLSDEKIYELDPEAEEELCLGRISLKINNGGPYYFNEDYEGEIAKLGFDEDE